MNSSAYDSVHLTPALHERRERVFLVLAGVFLGSMTMLNILGITRFIHIGPLALAVGVLPYPLTFLCTDFISEFYGRRRANFVVWVGLLLNVIVISFLWFGHQFPAISEQARPDWLPEGSWNPPPWQMLTFSGPVTMPFGQDVERIELFEMVYRCTRSSVLASMLAYMAAQFCDVYLFHFWKRLTKGRHLWLRNNGSTMVSQLLDTTAVILITYWIGGLEKANVIDPDTPIPGQLALLIATGYVFKLTIALLDTVPFYFGTRWLSRYLRIDPALEHPAHTEESRLET